jgi:hypothetical protein
MNPYLDELKTKFPVLKEDRELYQALENMIDVILDQTEGNWWQYQDSDLKWTHSWESEPVLPYSEEELLKDINEEKAHADLCPLQDYDDYTKWKKDN